MTQIDDAQVYDLLAQLIRIPSINPNLANITEKETSNETRIATFITNWLNENHIKAHTEEVQPGRLNVYAEVGSENGKTLCLLAHLDTVGVQNMTILPFDPIPDPCRCEPIRSGKLCNVCSPTLGSSNPFVIKNTPFSYAVTADCDRKPFVRIVVVNRLYGRGSCDMKAGLAAIMLATKNLAEEGLKNHKIILALVCDEEYSSIGGDDFVKRHKADACILTEPSDLNLVVANKGFLWCKVTVHGKSAHGSRWDLGLSAISKMGPILTNLEKYDREVLRDRLDELVGPASMHVSLIQGGTGVSTYADTCEIHIERRTLPSEKLEDVKKELENLIKRNCPDAKLYFYFSRPPYKIDENEPIVQSVKSAHQKIMHIPAKTQGCAGWTDAAIFQAAGIPTVNIGPIGYGLHEPVESVDLESVTNTTKILIEAAKDFFEK